MNRFRDGPAMSANPKVLFENHWQARKVRAVFWFIMLAGLGAVWAGWSIFQSYGLSPGDGGVLRPFWQRLLFGGAVAGLGLAAAYGVWLYVHLYVLHMARQGKELHIVSMTALGQREWTFQESELGQGAYHEGKVYGADALRHSHATPRVNAPWITLRARGQRWPFILDAQAETLDMSAIRKLAGSSLD